MPYAALAHELNTSHGALKVAIDRLRKRYRELFRQEIADTGADPADVESELRHLAADGALAEGLEVGSCVSPDRSAQDSPFGPAVHAVVGGAIVTGTWMSNPTDLKPEAQLASDGADLPLFGVEVAADFCVGFWIASGPARDELPPVFRLYCAENIGRTSSPSSSSCSKYSRTRRCISSLSEFHRQHPSGLTAISVAGS